MATATFSSISVQQLKDLCERGEVEVIDVRTPAEFREVHCTYARNVPLDSLDAKAVMAARNGSADSPLYVICRSGNRSGKACEAFVSSGFTNVVNVDGGTLAWDAAGLPVVRGKKTMSLERQVRIAAGFLVFAGTALGWFVNEYFYAIPAFVGAGLMFAGITDTCAMGMLIAKMPWNRVKTTQNRATDNGPSGGSGGACCSS